MDRGNWSAPVRLNFGTRGNRSVMNVFEALICLDEMWPNRSGPQYIRAKVACKAALEGRLTAEEAREEFVAAAVEAKVGG